MLEIPGESLDFLDFSKKDAWSKLSTARDNSKLPHKSYSHTAMRCEEYLYFTFLTIQTI